MSKLDTLYAAGYVVDCDFQHLVEHEQKVIPSWSIQNIAFPLGPHSPLTAKFPKHPTSATGTAGNWDEDNKYSLRAVHELGFTNPLSLGYLDSDTEPFEARGGSGAIVAAAAALGLSFDDFENELEQSSSNEVNDNFGGDMELPFAYSERPCETAESICDQQWDGVDELVHELTTRLGDSPILPIVSIGSEVAELKYYREGDGGPLQATPEVGSSPLIVNNVGEVNNRSEVLEAVYSGDSHGDILSALSAIQCNLNKVKAVVPHLPDEQHQLTILVRKQAAAAAVAVKLFSQIADAAASNVSDHQLHREIIHNGDQARRVHQHNEGRVRIDNTHNNFDDSEKTFIPSEGFASPEIAVVQTVQRIGAGKYPGSAAGSRSGSLGPVPVPVGATNNAPPAAYKNKRKLTGAPEAGATEQDVGLRAIKFATDDSWVDGKRLRDEVFKVVNTDSESNLQQLADHEPLSFDEDDFVVATGLAEAAGVSATSQEQLQFESASGSPAESDDGGDTLRGGDLPEGSYILMEIDDLEILTEQTHFCNICGKGFKRDANLRMHMRSHGGKFKASAALVRKEKPPKVAQEMVDGKPTRYSCPYLGCNRNMKHPKFQALKTMLCLKNHYRRSHCPKTLRCSICKIKQFSVVADLRTHEKHCGSDRWACSCGTTFSRKEKLFSHISLFVGHVPVDAAMASHVVSEVDLSAVDAGDIKVPPLQLEGIVDQPQRLSNRGESSGLWHGWDNHSA